jgi:hypothetical protein
MEEDKSTEREGDARVNWMLKDLEEKGMGLGICWSVGMSGENLEGFPFGE